MEWLTFSRVWIPLQLASMITLWVGSRFTDHPVLVRVGRDGYRRKMSAVGRVWPLTRLPAAVEERRLASATVILASVIILKSFVSLVFGLIMVFWLPIAALVVPAIVQTHGRSETALGGHALVIAALQVTSHAVAAALGMVWTVRSVLGDLGFAEVVSRDPIQPVVAIVISIGFAIAAGWREAVTLHRFGL